MTTRTRATLVLAVFAGLLLPAGVIAQTGGAQPSVAQPNSAQSNGTHLGKVLPPRAQPHNDEHITMPQFPGGWVQQAPQVGSIEVVDYFPSGQTDKTWTDKITLELHHGSNTLPIDVFQRRALTLMRENCTGVIEAPLQTGVNNGFPSAFWILGCQKSKTGNSGEVRYTKAVQGYATMYLLSRSWRVQPYTTGTPPVPAAEIEAAVQFLTTSVVCAQSPQHPCPTTAAAAARK